MRSNQIKLGLILLLTSLCLIISAPKIVEIFGLTFTRPGISVGNFKRDLDLKMGLDILGGARLVYDANMVDVPITDRGQALESTREVIERRVNLFGVSEAVVRSVAAEDSYRIAVELPGVTDIKGATELIGKTAQLEFRQFKEASDSAVLEPTLEDTVSTGVRGSDMKSFKVSFNTQNGSPAITFETTESGKDKFAQVTKSLVGKPLLAFLDDQVISIATVQEQIVGNGQISGKFTTNEAKQLATLFNAGSLPVPLKLISQENIGPTLGRESMQKSVQAGLAGLVVVVFFMVANYGRTGIIAVVGLFIYGLITLAIYKLMPVTLTVPGLAGLILSVGMAVDSNILIFERMKEELRAGKPWQVAMELGFGRAWESIKDANIATLITTFILFNPLNWTFLNTSGLVRGFALTLFLGIVISLFTGVVVTRTLMRVFLTKPGGNRD